MAENGADQEVTCTACGGPGDCPLCAGRRSAGCTICNGTGRCPLCAPTRAVTPPLLLAS
jgi:hypothetical protein